MLVPSEPHAHALRTELVTHNPAALAGTRFLTPSAAACAVLDAACIAYSTGEEELRPLRVRRIVARVTGLSVYSPADLRSRGWEEAFAVGVALLEAADLGPRDLLELRDPRADDLAVIWRALDEDAPSSWTTVRATLEAARLLERDPSAWPFAGGVLAAVGIDLDAATARLLRAIPHLQIGVCPGRPARSRALERMHALLGADVARAASATEAPANTDELGLVHAFLFEPPERLADPTRRRSLGPDGTVTLELHAGVDDELDAAVRWVVDEVTRRHTPLRELALLAPTPDPLTTLLADRLAELAWPADADPVYLPHGRPATASAAGARLLTLLRALQLHLPLDAMLELLPRLKLDGIDGHLSPGRARAVATRLGTLGGNAAHPDAAAHWRTRAAQLPDDPWITAIAPSLEALAEISDDLRAGAALIPLWQAIRAFAVTHLVPTTGLSQILDLLNRDLVTLAADRLAAELAGAAAIDWITGRLQALRLRRGRFGDPAIFVGTISAAAGLRFTAVRIIGLTEEAFPGIQRRDPILPAELRRCLPIHTVTTDDDYTTGRLHDLDRVLRGTSRCVLSAPRTDLEGSEREPASIFVEVAAALARPDALTGAPARPIPTMVDLERDAFRVARHAASLRPPREPSSWFAHAAHARAMPSAWSREPVIDPSRIAELDAPTTGLLGDAPLATAWGTAARPMSAKSLRTLLTCPQRFLLENVLGFRPRTDPPSGHEIDPVAYGTLFHTVVERFALANGAAFGARESSLEHWSRVIDDLACAAFAEFAESHPSTSLGAREVGLRRLRRDAQAFLADDWSDGRPRRFLAAELAFGRETPLAIPTREGELFVTGRIDRIDADDTLLIRDFKTGRPAHPDAIEHDLEVNLQLALYAAVAPQLAPQWAAPSAVAASLIYVSHRRRWDIPAATLATSARWFDLAAGLLRAHTYVKTPRGGDCRRCPFATVCGDHATATAEHLATAIGVLAEFRELVG
ncbi:MAG: PD-(D/E)XK nuclease family protein [Deltaproteobacteria bacterium]|nr:PD-(D/E)XK nuclease family protein [Deltaproteobacteria bacterium]